MKYFCHVSLLIAVIVLAMSFCGCRRDVNIAEHLRNRITVLAKNVDNSAFPERLPWMPSDVKLIYVGYDSKTKTAIFAAKNGIIKAADQALVRRHTTHPDSTNYLSVSFYEKTVHPVATDFKCIHWDRASFENGEANVATFILKDWELLKLTIPWTSEK